MNNEAYTEQAFNNAIQRGFLNQRESSDSYVGDYMYMHTSGRHDHFKHIETRKYMRVPMHTEPLSRDICTATLINTADKITDPPYSLPELAQYITDHGCGTFSAVMAYSVICVHDSEHRAVISLFNPLDASVWIVDNIIVPENRITKP